MTNIWVESRHTCAPQSHLPEGDSLWFCGDAPKLIFQRLIKTFGPSGGQFSCCLLSCYKFLVVNFLFYGYYLCSTQTFSFSWYQLTTTLIQKEASRLAITFFGHYLQCCSFWLCGHWFWSPEMWGKNHLSCKFLQKVFLSEIVFFPEFSIRFFGLERNLLPGTREGSEG